MVAVVDIAVVLHYQPVTARLAKSAESGRQAAPLGESDVEQLDKDASHIIFHPFIVNAANELSPLSGTNRVGRWDRTFGSRGGNVPLRVDMLQYGEELDEG